MKGTCSLWNCLTVPYPFCNDGNLGHALHGGFSSLHTHMFSPKGGELYDPGGQSVSRVCVCYINRMRNSAKVQNNSNVEIHLVFMFAHLLLRSDRPSKRLKRMECRRSDSRALNMITTRFLHAPFGLITL